MNRSFWILMTLMTRPVAWLLLAVLIVGGSVLITASTSKYVTVGPDVFLSAKPIRSAVQLQPSQQRDDQVEIDWGSLAGEQLDQILPLTDTRTRHRTAAVQATVNRRLAQLALPPNVVAIRTGSWSVSPAVLERLGRITSLQRLGLLVIEGEEPLDLSPLANLRNLQVLDLGLFPSDQVSLQPLIDLPQLTTLAISQRLVSPERMAEVAKLPALQTLYLPDVTENPRALAALRELSGSRSLQQIRVAVPLDQPGKFSAIQAVIPDVTLETSVYLPPRVYALIGVVWSTLMLSLLGMHFCGQFSLPMAELAPGFQRAHQQTTWVVLALVIVALTVVVCWFGASWLPVFGIVCLCLLMGVSESAFGPLQFGKSRAIRRLGSFFTAATFGLLCYLAYADPIAIEGYLSHAVWIPLGCLGLAGLQTIRMARGLKQACRSRIEAGRPMMLSIHDLQAASIELQSQRQATAAGDAGSQAFDPFSHQYKLSIVFAWASMIMAATSWLAPELTARLGGRSFIAMLCIMFAFWSLFVVGAKWWQRMPYLAGKITRPPPRAQQIEAVFKGVRTDVARLWPAAVAMAFLITSANFFSPENLVIRVAVSLLFVAGIAGICYATIMWTLTIRSVLGIAVLCCLVYFCISALTALTLATGLDGESALPTYRVVLASGAVVVLAGVGLVTARRYFRQLEWGRFL